MSQQQLAGAAKVGVVTVRQFEAGAAQPRNSTADVIQRALEGAGVEFTNGGQPGVRLAATKTVTEEGKFPRRPERLAFFSIAGLARARFERLPMDRKISCAECGFRFSLDIGPGQTLSFSPDRAVYKLICKRGNDRGCNYACPELWVAIKLFLERPASQLESNRRRP